MCQSIRCWCCNTYLIVIILLTRNVLPPRIWLGILLQNTMKLRPKYVKQKTPASNYKAACNGIQFHQKAACLEFVAQLQSRKEKFSPKIHSSLISFLKTKIRTRKNYIVIVNYAVWHALHHNHTHNSNQSKSSESQLNFFETEFSMWFPSITLEKIWAAGRFLFFRLCC